MERENMADYISVQIVDSEGGTQWIDVPVGTKVKELPSWLVVPLWDPPESYSRSIRKWWTREKFEAEDNTVPESGDRVYYYKTQVKPCRSEA